MADFSIIIVNWNARGVLLDCLASIRNSTDAATREVIVVDNASHDGSPAAVAEQFPEVRVIQTGANLGFAKANNIGMRAAQGAHLLLLNSDTLLLPGALDALLAYLAAHPRIGIAGPCVLNGDLTLQLSCRNAPAPHRLICRALGLDRIFARRGWFQGEQLFHWPHDTEREVEAISGCCMAVRREALAGVGLFDEGFFMYAEDIDWCARFRRAGWDVGFTPTAQIVHFGGGSSANAPARFLIERERAVLRYWQKYFGRPGQIFYAGSLFIQSALRLACRGTLFVFRPSRRPALRSKIRSHFCCLRWLSLSPRAWFAPQDIPATEATP